MIEFSDTQSIYVTSVLLILLCYDFVLGRSVKVRVKRIYVSFLLRVAIDVGFDWVKYESIDYVRLSVIPDSELSS